MTSNQMLRWIAKPVVFIASLGPCTWLMWAALNGRLSANPLADLTNDTGVWTLRVLQYWWLVKADVRRPDAYALVVGCLFAIRLWWATVPKAPAVWRAVA